MDVDPEANIPRRIEELWFEDGNLVIQAGNSQFQVYRGVLAARSPVFQDMLSFPQPPDSELVEGCPLVRLTDSEMEVEVFLKALYLPEFFMPFPSPTTFDVAAGCLRLSHKYGVDYLRRRALVHLSSGYDTKLSRRDRAVYATSHKVFDNLPASEVLSWWWPEELAHEIYAIQLLREVDALWLLPAAFYNLSASFHHHGRKIFHGTVYNGTQTNLSVHDQECFTQGHAIQSQSIPEILRFLTDPFGIAGCTSPGECVVARFRAAGEILAEVEDYLSSPLYAGGKEDMLEAVCSMCFAALTTTHQAARQAFWDKLPEIYCLPPWEELEQMKIAAIGPGWIS
ncbi:hypothetical protein B0H11DRAFT_2003874 [Mycena galericulata]|nr:hypothetical protein B0H11DRAFT_2003874 [Mycena galericulata]